MDVSINVTFDEKEVRDAILKAAKEKVKDPTGGSQIIFEYGEDNKLKGAVVKFKSQTH